MNAFFLKQTLQSDSVLNGEVKGVSYSGAPIANFYGYSNFIVDLSTLTIEKENTPILRDHNPAQVAGHGKVIINGNAIELDGKISKKTVHGAEIIALAEDGFVWEQSIGVFDGRVEEVKDTEINGIHINHGFVLRDGVLREISIVALGADSNTFATILSKPKGEPAMFKSKEEWVKFACACGGDKETTPEQLEAKIKAQSEEAQAEIAAKEAEIEALKAKIEELQSEIDKIKAEEEEEAREEEIEMALKEKGITLSAEKIKDAAKSKEKTEILLSVIAEMQEKKIDPKFSKKETIEGDKPQELKSPEAIRMAAEKMVKEGKAQNFFEAITKLEVK